MVKLIKVYLFAENEVTRSIYAMLIQLLFQYVSERVVWPFIYLHLTIKIPA